jgi:hypothetical protein
MADGRMDFFLKLFHLLRIKENERSKIFVAIAFIAMDYRLN